MLSWKARAHMLSFFFLFFFLLGHTCLHCISFLKSTKKFKDQWSDNPHVVKVWRMILTLCIFARLSCTHVSLLSFDPLSRQCCWSFLNRRFAIFLWLCFIPIILLYMIDELFSQNKKILLRKDLTFLFSISISGLGWHSRWEFIKNNLLPKYLKTN